MRFEVLQRDQFTCQYCGAKAPTVELVIDHRIPWAMGGQTVVENLVTACRPCNAGKAGHAHASQAFIIRPQRCNQCRRQAQFVCFLPWDVRAKSLEPRCLEHSEGYEVSIRDLVVNPAHWLNHLAGKRTNPDLRLLKWLREQGIEQPFPIKSGRWQMEVPASKDLGDGVMLMFGGEGTETISGRRYSFRGAEWGLSQS